MKTKTALRIISLIIVASTFFSLCLFAGCKKNETSDSDQDSGNPSDNTENNGGVEEPEPEPDYYIGIIADPQVTDSSVIVNPDTNPIYIEYMKKRQIMDMKYLSEAVFRTAIDRYIESDVDVVFIIGDITDDGHQGAIDIVKEGCDKLKAAGIPAYVTLGLNDFQGDPQRFVYMDRESWPSAWDNSTFFDLFTDCMDSAPIAIHDESMSYVADLPGDYRLISFNSAKSYDGNIHKINASVRARNTVDDEQLEWLKAQLIQAQNDGKEVVMTSYFPFNNDINYQCGVMYQDAFLTVDRADEIKPLLTEYGVKIVYNGHIQMDGESSYSDENGTVQFVSTTSLATYPLPLKISKHVGKKFLSEIGHNAAIDEEYLPEYIKGDDITSLTTDAAAFAKEYVKNAFVNKWRNETAIGKDTSVAKTIMEDLKLYEEDNAQTELIIQKLEGWLTGVNQMALYGETNSVEKICKKYGMAMPQISGYETVLDFISELSCTIFCGDMDMKPGSDNALMFKCIMYAGLKEFAGLGLFTELHKLNDSVADCNMVPMVSKMFATGKLDLSTNDFIVALLTAFVPLVQSVIHNFQLNSLSSATLLEKLDKTLPIMLIALGENYNASEGTIWLVPYKSIIDFSAGTINISLLLDIIEPSLICKNILEKR